MEQKSCIPEKLLHKETVKLFNLYKKTKNFIFFHIKNDIRERDKTKYIDLSGLGVLSGVSDFCIIKPNEVCFFEIKSLIGKLSNTQQSFVGKVKRFGHKAHVAYGWDDIKSKIKGIIGDI